ncbi:hypothetical protein ACJJTC_012044 [Scirpophaga incertulas]
MYYINSQRNLTRRDSSLVVSRKYVSNEDKGDLDTLTSARYPSTIQLTSESGILLATRPKDSVRNEIITLMFESMLVSIVESWQVTGQSKCESTPLMPYSKTPSELTISGKKKKIHNVKSQRGNKRSKLELLETEQTEHLQQCWWSSPDERAVVRFRNGNIYEGSISMKCMNGEGRFQWTDGTIYLGQFKENRMYGKGIIQWKDDTWYEGDFEGNVRHGRGLYVDSRNQRSYIGGWNCATKHGNGVIYYSGTFQNLYDGNWVHVYKGGWKNGVMSGEGVYIWDAVYNNSMTMPAIITYRGKWIKGQRDGYGVLNLGFGLGSYYKGHFKSNKKHGCGKFITHNGIVLQYNNLFVDDNIRALNNNEESNVSSKDHMRETLDDSHTFDLCDNSIGYMYHVHKAYENIDNQVQIRDKIIMEYLVSNGRIKASSLLRKDEHSVEIADDTNLKDIIEFEFDSLLKALRCYQSDLRNIYFHYATYNNDVGKITPILIRLYMWQMYYDINIHEKGLTLVEIDRMFHNNRQWLSDSPHNPFEKIYFWQFLHSLITVASKLYAKKKLPGQKPDTILATAFRCFMEKDIFLNVGRHRGD